MKSSFVFDKKTGTMVSQQAVVKEAKTQNKPKIPQQPEVRTEKLINSPNTEGVGERSIKMKRVNTPTPVQLIGNDGKLEAYLDSVNTGVLMFKERQDYDVCQITDERSGKVLAYIGGYALEFNFNMSELNSMERIEQCLQGLMKLFRHKIMNQPIDLESNG
ncbi:MAG: hypothetical protein ACI4Q6_05940 [Huintestinicola sp.]